ncbi:MAG: glycosyltransferase [Patescibacteria group bacterium]
MTICYASLGTSNARDQATIRALRATGTEVTVLIENTRSWIKFGKLAQKYFALKEQPDLLIVGYASAIFVPLLRLISRKRIIYNALAPLYDGMVTSRGNNQKISLTAIKYWLIDWLAFHTAHHVLVESELQKKFVTKTFLLAPNRVSVTYTSVNQNDFFFDSQIKKLVNFTVVFRGNFLPEAGAEVVVKAAKILEKYGIKFRIIGRGLLELEVQEIIKKLQPENLELITEILPFETLRQKMQECHLALGQMANHPRLSRTIPNKAFEVLAMKLPYLTGRQPAILELLEENSTCFCNNPGDPADLAQKILDLSKQPELLNIIAERGFALYQQTLTEKITGQRLLKITTVILT